MRKCSSNSTSSENQLPDMGELHGEPHDAADALAQALRGVPLLRTTAQAFAAPRRVRQPAAQPNIPNLIASWGHQVRAHQVITPKSANIVAPPVSLHDAANRALRAKGLTGLYSHQAEALGHMLAGRDVVLATPTASGKSLPYGLAIIDALARDHNARALLVYPTKALARDQQEALRRLVQGAELDCDVVVYDGDTPQAERVAARSARVVITNPDMLHQGMVPQHARWKAFFAGLRYVVVDELHSYSGLFGAHVANLIARLDRVARHHGGTPTFVGASATIGNPDEHAERMFGRPVQLVSESGAPTGERHIVIYEPPLLDPARGYRKDHEVVAGELAAQLVRAGVSTMVFATSRNAVEKIRRQLNRSGIESALESYRGGYLPNERRATEARLRAGASTCVVTTNALELGIDIGAFDAVVSAGYPGTVASLWQQFGRAGRRQGVSLGVLVPSASPLDQLIATRTDLLLDGHSEELRIDPEHVDVLKGHLRCAAFELPLASPPHFGSADAGLTEALVEELVHDGALEKHATGYKCTKGYPAGDVAIRSEAPDNVVVTDVESEEVVAEMDFRSAVSMLHDEAIYRHAGRQYFVEHFDYRKRRASVHLVECDYYTQAAKATTVDVTSVLETSSMNVGSVAADAAHGRVRIVDVVSGFKKLRHDTHENIGAGDVDLPPLELETEAFWLALPRCWASPFGWAPAIAADVIAAFGSALHAVSVVGLMAHPRDLRMVVAQGSSTADAPAPAIYLYDAAKDGAGLAARVFDARDELVGRVRELLESCRCEHGCPSCIGVHGSAVDLKAAVHDLVTTGVELRRTPLGCADE